jgi:hypothetical protein
MNEFDGKFQPAFSTRHRAQQQNFNVNVAASSPISASAGIDTTEHLGVMPKYRQLGIN